MSIILRILNAVFCALMVLFIVVQFNDPDGPLWATYYAVSAIWAGFVALRLNSILGGTAFKLLCASVLAALVLVIYYWPRTPGFWHQEIWWETETAREGMGIMIATLVLLVALFTVWRARNSKA